MTSTPRKKCEKDLLSRLLFLVKELEPWEHKLMSANRRAKLRMKKEKENYVEEKEREQVNSATGTLYVVQNTVAAICIW